MTVNDTRTVAARAAYRLGLCEAMLAAVDSGDIDMPGIYVEVLRGERAMRLQELHRTGVLELDLEDMRLKEKQ